MNKKLISNTFYLAISNILSKVLYFGVIFLVIENIGASNYGMYAIALNYISLFSLVTIIGFDTVLVKEGSKNIKELENLQNLFFPVRFYWSLLIFIIALITLIFINYEKDVKICILIMSPIILFGGNINSGLSEHFSIVVRVLEKMQYIAYSSIVRIFIISSLSGLLFFYDNITVYNFCIILSVVSVCNVLITYYYSQKFIKNKFTINISFTLIRDYLKPILMFGMVTLVFGFGGLIDIAIISSHLELDVLGYYSLAITFVGLLINFISSFQVSIYPFIAKSKGDFKMKLGLSYLYVLIAIVVFNLLVNLVILDLAVLIIGGKYQFVMELIDVFIWVLPFKVIMSWINVNLDLENKYNTKLVLALIYLISLILILKTSIDYYDVFGVIYSLIFSNILIVVIYFLTMLIKRFRFAT